MSSTNFKQCPALIVKQKWIDKILKGKKIWTIKNHHTKYIGKVYLISQNSKKIRGHCNLTISFETNLKTLRQNSNRKKHQIFVKFEKTPIKNYKPLIVWKLRNVICYKKSIPCEANTKKIGFINLSTNTISKLNQFGY